MTGCNQLIVGSGLQVHDLDGIPETSVEIVPVQSPVRTGIHTQVATGIDHARINRINEHGIEWNIRKTQSCRSPVGSSITGNIHMESTKTTFRNEYTIIVS